MRIDRESKYKYGDETEECYKGRMLWFSFKETVFYHSRYYVKHPLLNILSDYISQNILKIDVDREYYRARIIDDSSINDHMVYRCYGAPEELKLDVKYHSKSNRFRGLTKEASFVPTRGTRISDGRANPQYIPYLYMSESPTTALFEVRPFISDAVNLARIKVIESLKIADIAVDLQLSSKKDATMEMYVMGLIQGAFSRPTNNSDDYLPTQVIAEYIRNLSFDGIRFNSSLHLGGVNLTIFNYEKFEAISSQDFRINEIKISARAAENANFDGDLCYIIDNEPKYIDYSVLNKFNSLNQE